MRNPTNLGLVNTNKMNYQKMSSDSDNDNDTTLQFSLCDAIMFVYSFYTKVTLDHVGIPSTLLELQF